MMEAPFDDEQLTIALKRGDPSAQDAAYRAFRPLLLRTCTYFLGYQDPEVEDVVQEAFLAAFEKIPSFEYRGSGSLQAWIKRIAVNRCYNRWRHRDKLILSEETDMELFSRSAAVSGMAVQEEDEQVRLQKEALREARAKMGSPCREMLDLRDSQGLSYAEIGRRLKVPMGTVMSRLSRCRESLKQLVERRMEGKR
jgi:RNA polymerase sigma-70 factor (ECF subfamily)